MQYGTDKLLTLVWFVIAVYAGLVLVLFVVYPILVKSHGLSIKQFLVSVGTVIYIFIAVQLFRYHKPLIINDMIAFANQYDVVEKDAGRTGTSLCHYGYGRPYDLVQPDLFGDHGQRSVL